MSEQNKIITADAEVIPASESEQVQADVAPTAGSQEDVVPQASEKPLAEEGVRPDEVPETVTLDLPATPQNTVQEYPDYITEFVEQPSENDYPEHNLADEAAVDGEEDEAYRATLEANRNGYEAVLNEDEHPNLEDLVG